VDYWFVGHWGKAGTIQIEQHVDDKDNVTGLTAIFPLREGAYHDFA
jgi:hypothetical protein